MASSRPAIPASRSGEFSCRSCGCPSISVASPLRAATPVVCGGCGSSIASWSDFCIAVEGMLSDNADADAYSDGRPAVTGRDMRSARRADRWFAKAAGTPVVRTLLALVLAGGLAVAGEAAKADGTTDFARGLCLGLASSVDASAPAGQPVWIVSYTPGQNEATVPGPLKSSAFVYDNALALVALVACGDAPRALQIGDAILSAIERDRRFQDGRVRNAYRAGIVPDQGSALLPGWWDDAAGLWAEDSYQDGSASGNVAWAAIALLTLHQESQQPRYLRAVAKLLGWIDARTRATQGPGYTGGLDGFDDSQTPLTWASTEHNVDIAAAAQWYGRVSERSDFAAMAASARQFVDSSFIASTGCFRLGTNPNGEPADPTHLALDTQLWPQLLSDPSTSWRAATHCAERNMGVEGGFDFDNDRDGLWVEGTAQAALVYWARGDRPRAANLLAGLRRDLAPSGWLYATRRESLTTGLKIGPQSTTADFIYFRRPHLGATAWAALAALGWNPFLGRIVE